MRVLPKPAISAKQSFEKCFTFLGDCALKTRLATIVQQIVDAESLYLQKAQTKELFTIPEGGDIGSVTKKELENLYKYPFSKEGTAPRVEIYDVLRAVPRDGICPLCCQRVVSTLDHYLAKTKHPALAVTPINLIPACSDCNKTKSASQPNSPEEQTLHPYFDDLGIETFLFATVIAGNPPALVFYVEPPANWENLTKERVTRHFSKLKLGALYSVHAGVELTNINALLKRLAVQGGGSAVRAFLMEQRDSRKAAARNSWQTATYEALAGSNWFCTVGYNY